MKIKLLNKKYKGIFISFSKYGIYLYLHFSKITYRISYSIIDKKINITNYSTVNFNKHIELDFLKVWDGNIFFYKSTPKGINMSVIKDKIKRIIERTKEKKLEWKKENNTTFFVISDQDKFPGW